MYRNKIQKQWLIMSNKCQRTPNGQSKTEGTKTKKKQNKRTIQYVPDITIRKQTQTTTTQKKQHEPSHKQPEAT